MAATRIQICGRITVESDGSEPRSGAVGTAKALSELHPRFFPMWDTNIAIAYLGYK